MRFVACAMGVFGLACLAACTDPLLDDEEAGVAASGSSLTGNEAYVQLSFLMGEKPINSTRASAGENGDGWMGAQAEEYKVNSAGLFLYQTTDDKGINELSDTEAQAVAVKYVAISGDELESPSQEGEEEGIDYVTSTVAVPVLLKGYDLTKPVRLLAVVNPTFDCSTIENLGQLRDYEVKSSVWEGTSSADYGNFTMSSTEEAEATIGKDGEGTQLSPLTFDPVPVSRLAARVDYRLTPTSEVDEGGFDDDNSIEAPFEMEVLASVFDGDNYQRMTGAVTCKIAITGAMLVNDLTEGSYLLKHVSADGSTDNITYLGTEEGSDNKAENYVLDPYTTEKDGSDLSGYYGVPYAAASQANEQWTTTYWDERIKVLGGDVVKDDGDEWNRIGYTRENTVLVENTSKQYCTGVVFQAQLSLHYSENVYDDDISLPPTFFIDQTINDREGLVCPMPLLELDGQTSPSSTDKDYYISLYYMSVDKLFTTDSKWDDVNEFVSMCSADDRIGYCDYLSEKAEGKTPTDEIGDEAVEELQWSYYALNYLGYSSNYIAFSDGDGSEITVTLNQNDINTREALYKVSGGRIRTYEDGKCYYLWWIRHADDKSDETNGVMEYDIVRNNVYKLIVDGVSGLGGDVPSESVDANITVRSWTEDDEEVLPM